jgi:hypothetical protein
VLGLHDAGVVHRDIKPANILVRSNCDLVLCDFGLARGMDGDIGPDLTQNVVTRWYRAPELLCHAPHYGKPVDMWSVGCVFAEFLLRVHAVFPGTTSSHQLQVILERIGTPSPEELCESGITDPQIRNFITNHLRSPRNPWPVGPHHPNFTAEAVDLLDKLLCFNQHKRITAAQALAHPYFYGLADRLADHSVMPRFDFDIERPFPAEMPREMLEHCMIEIETQMQVRNHPLEPAFPAMHFLAAMEREQKMAEAREKADIQAYGTSNATTAVDAARAAVAAYTSHMLKYVSRNNVHVPNQVTVGGGAPFPLPAPVPAGMMEMVQEVSNALRRHTADPAAPRE